MAASRHDDETRNPLPWARLRLLATRLIESVGEAKLDSADETWARSVLTPAEFDLWQGLSAYDRCHAVRVARKVERRLAPTAHGNDTVWAGAALMHDVGKVASDLAMHERVVATLASRVVGVATARRWARSATGAKRRIGSYLIHGEIGAGLIRAAGGREEVAAWTEVHQDHRAFGTVGLPPLVVEALLDSDVG
ncbi:MAG TPA: hypothetical protein VN032_04700 [Thermoanaerobaculia bacterium]|nr:hypothetical protein [Thermoanaerobaculia bacterium]